MKKINLEKLMRAQFDLAKLWLMLATSSSIGVLLIDIVVVIVNQWVAFFAFTAALLTVLNSVFLWRSDRLRATAETWLRKFEMDKSLGWEINAREIADLLAAAPRSVKEAARTDEEYEYFASTRNVGPKKLLENLEESTWWSKHQARRMSKYVGAFGIIALVIAFITLVISLQSALSASFSDSIAKIAISIIVFMFSGGYIKLAFDYNLFANQAHKIGEKAFQLQEDEISEVEVIKLLHDYQIDRAGSPLIPSWLWKIVGKELNELWNERLQQG